MKNERPEQLLQALIDGEITPAEFKRRATAPKWAIIFFVEEAKEHIGQMEPEDLTIVIIDGVMQEMRWKEFDAFRKQWPDAEYMPIMFFAEDEETE